MCLEIGGKMWCIAWSKARGDHLRPSKRTARNRRRWMKLPLDWARKLELARQLAGVELVHEEGRRRD